MKRFATTLRARVAQAARRRALALAAASALFSAGAADAAETLRLAGSNTVGAKLAPALVEAYARAQGLAVSTRELAPEERVLTLGGGADAIAVEIRAHGTSTGYAALLRGEADVWMASRPVTRDEVAGAAAIGALDAPAQEHVIALDGLAIVVHPRNPVRSLSVEQIAGVFTGKVRDWAELGGAPGPITVLARDGNSGTFDTFKTLVLGKAPLAAGARRYESSDRLALAVATEPGAIGFVGLAAVGGARALAIGADGVQPLEPTVFAVATEDYALSRRLFLYHRKDAGARIRALVELALAAGGQAVVEKTGFVAQDIRSFPATPHAASAGEYDVLTRGAERLSVNFRFSSGESFLDTKALRDLDRLAAWLEARRGTVELMLFGFVDGTETHPVQALALSADRADFVAAELGARGVPATRVRGVGGAAPVTSDASELGRGRNRRVEVWVRALPGARVAATNPQLRRNGAVAAGR